jgi:hypothetical protein
VATVSELHCSLVQVFMSIHSRKFETYKALATVQESDDTNGYLQLTRCIYNTSPYHFRPSVCSMAIRSRPILSGVALGSPSRVLLFATGFSMIFWALDVVERGKFSLSYDVSMPRSSSSRLLAISARCHSLGPWTSLAGR